MHYTSSLMHYITAIIIASVLVEDLILFYLLFEVMLLVMYCTVSSYWYNTRTCYALSMLVVYTVVGSGCMACAMVMQYVVIGITYSMHSIEDQLLPAGSEVHTLLHRADVILHKP